MEFLILLPFLIVALTVHEFAHAFVAYKLGDPTPKMQGRVTLNPLAHLDPVGTLVLVISSLAGFGFGWGKPVTFNPYNLKHPKRDAGIVAAAGPISNILMAALGLLILAITSQNSFIQAILISFILINCLLATFNLIPIYPLDGFNVTMAFLPKEYSAQFGETAKYGTILLIILIVTGATRIILNPVLSFVMGVISIVIR